MNNSKRGLYPFPCEDCGSHFWIKPASAQKVTASGKMLRCRDCAGLKGYDVAPWPYCARLTEEERLDYEWEVSCQEQNIQNLKEAASPTPPMESKTLLYPPEMEQLRQRLQNSLTASGTTAAAFAYKADIARPGLERFLAKTGLRLPKNVFLAKIENAMTHLGWIGGQATLEEFLDKTDVEPTVEDTEADENLTGFARVEIQEEDGLTPREKATLVWALMNLPGDKEDNYELLSKVLPDDFPLAA